LDCKWQKKAESFLEIVFGHPKERKLLDFIIYTLKLGTFCYQTAAAFSFAR